MTRGSLISFVLLLLLCPCCGGDARAATVADDSPEPGTRTLTMEENGGSVIKHLGDYTLAMGSIRLGVRSIVWRSVSPGEVFAPKVRLGFGYWGGEGFGAFMGEDFQENTYFQLDMVDCENLVELVNEMERARFLQPGEHIQYRDLDGVYEGVRLRKFPDGQLKLFFWEESDIGEIWLDIAPADFRSFLEDSLAVAHKLQQGEPSIEWQ